MFNLAISLDTGQGVAAPDHTAALDWYKRAFDAGLGDAAYNLCAMHAEAGAYTRPHLSST
jgi:TPR repeat protein